MSRFIITTILTIVFYFNVLGQNSLLNKPRILLIKGSVNDSTKTFDLVKGFPIKIYVFSTDKTEVYDVPEHGSYGMALDSGSHKVLFSKVGYKSKLLIVEVGSYRSKNTTYYETPVNIELVPGLEEERELKPIGKIFYNPKKDYYDVMKF